MNPQEILEVTAALEKAQFEVRKASQLLKSARVEILRLQNQVDAVLSECKHWKTYEEFKKDGKNPVEQLAMIISQMLGEKILNPIP
jgi:hypothetical protein